MYHQVAPPFNPRRQPYTQPRRTNGPQLGEQIDLVPWVFVEGGFYCTVYNLVLVSLVTTNLSVISHVLNFYWLYIYANVTRVGVVYFNRF